MTNNISVGEPIHWEKGLGVIGVKGFNGLGIRDKGERVRAQGVQCHGVEVLWVRG